VGQTPSRPSGAPPYFDRGQVVDWHYRRPGWQAGDAETVQPLTVVRDDADGLVAWLAVGTPYLLPRLADGGDLRSGGASTMFTAPRVQGQDVWHSFHTLRIAPTGRAWSVWMWFEADSCTFDGYYVNLEDPHVRDQTGVYSSDHVLDIEVETDRRHRRKDVDELAEAVRQGRYTPAEAARIEATANEVEAVVEAWGSPFRDGWETFRPDPSWPVPGLPRLPPAA
jgi:predicted RNA-binding protein associated with RNAse of E/G family